MNRDRLLWILVVAIAVWPPPRAWAACSPSVQWVWNGPTRAPDYPQVTGDTLVVARLTDSNGDGSIDTSDIPDVLLEHGSTITGECVISALDGRTGATLWTTVGTSLHPAPLAVADIDGDGRVEILAIHNNKQQLVAFENDGKLKWLSDLLPANTFQGGAAPGVADLDQDGVPEIYVGPYVFNADGKLLWVGSAGRGDSGGRFRSSAVEIVATNPGLELLAGNTAYASDGSIVWTNPNLPDGWTAVADFDGDGEPEIVLVQPPNSVYLLDHLGNQVGSRYDPGGFGVSLPVVGDLDGDGLPELVLGNGVELRALKWNGLAFGVMWSKPVNISGHAPDQPPTLFDFDGDGALEVVYRADAAWYVLDGRTGSVLDYLSAPGTVGSESPVIADIDNDCRTEILRCGGDPFVGTITAYECADGVPARGIWNQTVYHVTNINDDGTVPQFEKPPWQAQNTWLGQIGYRVPNTLGNTLRARRSAGNVELFWTSIPDALSYAVYRGTAKGVWPSPGLLSGLSAPAATLADIASPPALYFYRVVAANCAGVEGP